MLPLVVAVDVALHEIELEVQLRTRHHGSRSLLELIEGNPSLPLHQFQDVALGAVGSLVQGLVPRNELLQGTADGLARRPDAVDRSHMLRVGVSEPPVLSMDDLLRLGGEHTGGLRGLLVGEGIDHEDVADESVIDHPSAGLALVDSEDEIGVVLSAISEQAKAPPGRVVALGAPVSLEAVHGDLLCIVGIPFP